LETLEFALGAVPDVGDLAAFADGALDGPRRAPTPS
jgi:hypothetical protein